MKNIQLSKTLVSSISLIAILFINSQSFAKQEFKKVIKDGKVTYLPVKAKKEIKTSSEKKQNSEKPNSSIQIKDIELYESSECTDCRRIRRFFYSNKIDYKRKDISINKVFNHELEKRAASNITPALYISGKRIQDVSSKNLRALFKTIEPKKNKLKAKQKYDPALDPEFDPSTVGQRQRAIERNKARLKQYMEAKKIPASQLKKQPI